MFPIVLIGLNLIVGGVLADTTGPRCQICGGGNALWVPVVVKINTGGGYPLGVPVVRIFWGWLPFRWLEWLLLFFSPEWLKNIVPGMICLASQILLTK